jgi:hypothetical protein
MTDVLFSYGDYPAPAGGYGKKPREVLFEYLLTVYQVPMVIMATLPHQLLHQHQLEATVSQVDDFIEVNSI